MCTRALDRAINGGIASAPADIAGQSGPDGVHRWPGPKGDGGENHSWRADAALRAAKLHESTLHRVTAAESLDGRHLGSSHLRKRDEARIDGRPIDQDGAGTALA